MSRPIVVIVCMDAPPNRGSFNSAHIRGTHVPVEEPSTASGADIYGHRAGAVLKKWTPLPVVGWHTPARLSPLAGEGAIMKRWAIKFKGVDMEWFVLGLAV